MARHQARERGFRQGHGPCLQGLRAAGARADAQRAAELNRRGVPSESGRSALGRANGGRQQMPAGVGRTLLTGRSGIGAGHQDRLRIAIEPLLQADCIVLGPVRLARES